MEAREMSKVCQVTGKKTSSGNNVSHANNRTRRKFFPNLHTHRIWVESQNKFVKLRITKKGLRTIDKLGIDHVLSNLKEFGEKG
jgi:large subunit ribosomal protein L28